MLRNGYSHQVLDHYVGRVRSIREDRRKRLASIRTRKQALAYQEEVLNSIKPAFRPIPRKTPLNARIAGVIECPNHRIEKLTFESRPGSLVTANLYVPNRLNGPAPAVIGSCGHASEGKASAPYQGFCQRLTNAGFVTLIFDPFNQGERDQYSHLIERQPVRSSTHAHNMMGKQLDLLGQWFGAWRAWDGIRALDYLLTRPEVDPTRIGLTGNSGGGTMTSWIWAVEPRFTMAAPSCFVTTFLANLENELPADAEQYPPGVIGKGLEMADFFIARAPKPTILMGQNFCFFDRRGLREAYSEVQRFYEILKAPTQNTELFIGPQGHGYSAHNQEAMVAFFSYHANGKRPRKKFSVKPLGADSLNATPAGEVIPAGATPIYDLIASEADRLGEKRKKLSRLDLKRCLARLLTLPPRSVPHFRCLRAAGSGRIRTARYAIETEDNIRVILHKRLQNHANCHTLDVQSEVRVYLPHIASEADLSEDKLAVKLARRQDLYAVDVRGLGESLPDDTREFLHPYGIDYMNHGYGLLLGESFVGRRVHDVLSTLDLLVAEGARKIHLFGRGQGAILALFSALLHAKISTVTLKNVPLSFYGWTQVPLVAWPAANIPRGILKILDLPDCIRALGKKVSLIQPWGPDMSPLSAGKRNKAIDESGLSSVIISRG